MPCPFTSPKIFCVSPKIIAITFIFFITFQLRFLIPGREPLGQTVCPQIFRPESECASQLLLWEPGEKYRK